MQGLYCTVFMYRTETGVDDDGNAINDSSCTMQSRWDWSDSSVSNKWATAQQCYKHQRLFNFAAPSATYEDGYPVVTAKLKVRGRGRAVHFKFQGAAGKDMQIVGWHVTYLGNSNV